VSTGTIRGINEKLVATRFGEIDSPGFYILNFPVCTIPVTILSARGRTAVSPINPMEFAAIFRPHTHIENGITKELSFHHNEFFCLAQ